MAVFAGSYIEGSFFGTDFFQKTWVVHVWFCLTFSLQLKNANRTNTVPFVTFLLIFEKMAIFWPFSPATYWGDFFEMGTYNNFITKNRQWVPNGLSRRLPSESIFFQECFDFGHAHRCKLSTSVGCSINWRYFNSALASTIFSKNFLTNFFFG